MRTLRRLALFGLALAAGCSDDSTDAAGVDPGDGGLSPSALRVVFLPQTGEVLCNGRLLPCVEADDGCVLELEAATQGWGDEVVLCLAAGDEAVLAPLVPLVFKNGLSIWAPNLDAAGTVRADERATAVGTAFLSPYLTALYPETARALLAQTAASPYLDALALAVERGDREGAAAAVPRVVADVLAQGALSSGLTDASRSLGMEHIEVEQTSGYIAMDARLGTSVDHICVVYAMDECALESAQALADAEPADVFPKAQVGRTYVPAKSYFKLQNLAREALTLLFGDLLPRRELDTFRLEPGRVHDVQCYSGALGLADEDDARVDAILIEAEPDGRYLRNVARVTNLVSLATETLRIFVDFDAFDDGGRDIAEAVAICTQEALGPALALVDGTSREDWFTLLKTVQGCAIKRLGVVLAKRGLYAVAAWVLDFAADGGTGIVGKVSRVGMLLDRVVGMVALMSPVQRRLIAHAVDFEACTPCEDLCPEAGAVGCADAGAWHECVAGDACLDWGAPLACGEGAVCDDGACIPCGQVGEACCARDTCASGNACDGGECVVGCREECRANGASECAGGGAVQVCGEHDGDPCLEWRVDDCPDGEVCAAGACGPPACDDECAPDALRCAPDGEAVERCGQCDADGCRDWCEPVACEAHFRCEDAACACDEEVADLPDVFPGARQADLDDSGVSVLVENSLWPEGESDVFNAHIRDRVGDTLLPRVDVHDAAPGLVYDLCLAWQCDPDENDGEPSNVDCDGALRTTRDGLPACCRLGVEGQGTVTIDVNCTPGGLSNDSGTAHVYVESVEGAQCWRPLRMTLTGGHD